MAVCVGEGFGAERGFWLHLGVGQGCLGRQGTHSKGSGSRTCPSVPPTVNPGELIRGAPHPLGWAHPWGVSEPPVSLPAHLTRGPPYSTLLSPCVHHLVGLYLVQICGGLWRSGIAVPTPPDTQAPAAPPLFLDLSPVNPHSSAQFTTCDRTGEKWFS